MVNIFSYKETLDKIWAKAEGLNETSSGIISHHVSWNESVI